MLGDHGAFHKSLFYEPSARVPFLVRIPARYGPPHPAGAVVAEPALLVDLYATCLDLAGCLETADAQERDGRSVLRLGTEGRPGAPRWVFGQCGAMRQGTFMATDGQWKYIYYVAGGREQLFNLADDPAECQDLAGAPAARSILVECRARLGKEIPELAAGGAGPANGERPPFQVMDAPALEPAAARAANPFAWRGPIRYGGHW
jgi:arylsulfatase A-like enzyme